jgi:hypothetical protein
VIDKLKPPTGLLVRVGTPQLPEVARNPAVSLPQLKAARCQQVADRRTAVEQRLVELGRVTKRVEDLTTALKEFDHEAYLRATTLLTAERRIPSIAEQAQERAIARVLAGTTQRASRDRAARGGLRQHAPEDCRSGSSDHPSWELESPVPSRYPRGDGRARRAMVRHESAAARARRTLRQPPGMRRLQGNG